MCVQAEGQVLGVRAEGHVLDVRAEGHVLGIHAGVHVRGVHAKDQVLGVHAIEQVRCVQAEVRALGIHAKVLVQGTRAEVLVQGTSAVGGVLHVVVTPEVGPKESGGLAVLAELSPGGRPSPAAAVVAAGVLADASCGALVPQVVQPWVGWQGHR